MPLPPASGCVPSVESSAPRLPGYPTGLRLSRGTRESAATLRQEMRERDDIDRLHDEIKELVDDLWQAPRFVFARRGFRPNAACMRNEDLPELHGFVGLPGDEP